MGTGFPLWCPPARRTCDECRKPSKWR